MKRLLGLSLVLGLAPACVLAVNVKGNNLHDDGVDDTDTPWEEPAGDTDPAADSAPEPELHVTATLDPAEMDAGAVELIQLVATADIADATLVGVSFDDT
ncbi:MAG TPA: hypothetical protein PKA64_26105, partial [Myxococcota bacterium]|nr:hypothetical protein [Myxococcota bacterium]